MNHYQEITNYFIDKLEKGTIPWKIPWKPGLFMPSNFSTKNLYNGINLVRLSMEREDRNYSTNLWIGYNQARIMKGHIRKGAKGTKIYFYKTIKMNDDVSIDKDEYTKFIFKAHTVFNMDQTENIDYKQEDIKFNNIEEAEKLYLNWNNHPGLRTGDHASYTPSKDMITIPPKDTFIKTEPYYSTLYHEMIHATGSKDRLNRKEKDNYHTEKKDRAREELIAEIGAAILCAKVGLDTTFTLDNSASYIKSWIEVLRNDPKVIVYAATRAGKGVEYIMEHSEEALAS
jgi:antirestriction protein ArdC